METAPFPTNQTASTVDKAIDGVFGVATSLGKNALFVAVPWTNWPILRNIVGYLIDKFSDLVYKNFALFVTFKIIEIQVGGQVSDSNAALAELKRAQISGDAHAIELALERFANATAALTHLDGSATP